MVQESEKLEKLAVNSGINLLEMFLKVLKEKHNPSLESKVTFQGYEKGVLHESFKGNCAKTLQAKHSRELLAETSHQICMAYEGSNYLENYLFVLSNKKFRIVISKTEWQEMITETENAISKLEKKI